MSSFTTAEISYLDEQRLGRLATVDATGGLHVVPVGFRHNEELDTIDIGGHNLSKTKKFRDAGATGKAAFVVDDVLPPWKARGVEVRGRTEIFSKGGGEIVEGFSEELIRIFPERIVGWGLDPDTRKPNTRSVS